MAVAGLLGIMLWVAGAGAAQAQTPPAAPENPAAMPGYKLIQLSWDSETGADYQTQYRKSDETAWTSGPSGTSGSTGTETVDVTKLDSATYYDLRVRDSVAGSKVWSEWTKPVSAWTQPDPPGNPAVAIEGKLAHFSWDGKNTKYYLEYKKHDESEWSHSRSKYGNTDGRVTYVLHPPARTMWDFRVREWHKDASLYSPWSEVVTAATEILRPPAPVQLAVRTHTNYDVIDGFWVELSWKRPQHSQSAHWNANIEHRRTGTATWTGIPNEEFPIAGTDREGVWLMNQLIAGQEYEFRVQYRDFLETEDPPDYTYWLPGPWAEITGTVSRAPEAPALTVEAAGIGEIKASWEEATSHDLTVTGYEVTWDPLFGNHKPRCNGKVTLGAEVRELLIDSCADGSLVTDREYRIYVLALAGTEDTGFMRGEASHGEAKPGKSEPPSAPLNLKGKESDSQVILTWDPPKDDGGQPISDYDVKYKEALNGVWQSWTHDSAETTATITGLTNTVRYVFQVQASNSAGTGGWSQGIYVTVNALPEQAYPPEPVPGDGQMDLNWAHRGDTTAITDYDVEYREESAATWQSWTHDSAETTATITGLVNGTSYAFRIRASIDDRTGPWSRPSIATAGAILPGVPESLWSLALGSGKVRVTWISPNAYENGQLKYGPPTSYEVDISVKGEDWSTGPDRITGIAADAYRVTVDKLTNGVSYSFRVRAVNAAGNGPWSGVLHETPQMSVPDGVMAMSGDGSVGLSWQMPGSEDSGADESGSMLSSMMSNQEDEDSTSAMQFEVSHMVEGSDWSAGEEQTVNGMSTSVSGLENGQAYVFRVRAVEEDEMGAWSDTVTATPEASADTTRPTGVTGATTAATAWKTLDMSFNAPADGTDWVVANSQYRLRSVKEGAQRTPWKALQNVTVEGQRVSGSTDSFLAVGRIFELEVRWCGATISDAACSEASDMAYGASPASAPETAQASATDPASQTALGLAWSIANTGGKKNMHAAYEIGWSADSAATAPETLLDTVPAFGETAAEIGGLTAGTEYRLFVRSVIDHEGDRLFSSAWASATATTEAPPALALGEGPGDQVWPLNEAIEDLVLPEATGGTGAVSYELTPISTGFLVGCGLTFDAPTRTISGTPLCLGHNTFTWTATDEAGATDSLEFTATVAGSAPVFVGEGPADPAWTVGAAVSLTLPEASTQAPPLTYALAPAAWNGVTVDTETRTLSGTPAAAGSQAFTWTVTDAAGQSTSLTFTATVTASDTVAPTAALALADGVETPAVAPFSITVTFSEAVTGFALDDLTVAHGAASELAGSGASYSTTITPEEGYAGNLTVDVAAGAAQDAAGNASTAAETLTVAVAPPVTKPTGVAPNTTAATSWKTLDLSFDAPPAYTGWTAAQSQYRVRSMKEGARRTPWRTLQSVSVENGTASASTGSYLAVGRVFEVELRYCGETISDAACSEASDMVYGASPASAPENAQASATEPASETALKLSWSIANIGGKKNMHATYEIGYAADTGATAPETLLTAVPDFGATEAEVGGLAAGGDYRLFVRSVIDWQGARLFASAWASAVAATSASVNSLADDALKTVLSNQARRLLEDASDVIGRRMADGGGGSDTVSAFAGLFGGEGPGGCTLGESIEDCVTRGASGGGGLGFGPGDRFGGDREGGWSGSLSDLRGLVKSRGFAVSLNRPLPQAGAPFSQDASVPDEGMQLTFWGEGAASQSGGALFWGMDASGAGWMTGVAFAESGEGVTGALSRGDARVTGFAQSEVSAVYPYAKGRFGSGLEVWSLAGWGTGHVDSTWTGFASVSGPEEVIRLQGDLGFAMGLFGAEQVLYEQDGLSLSALGDAGWSQLSVSGGAADGLAASVSRTRFGLEGRYASGDGAWTSALRLGGRVDGGDGETASGAEISGDVHHRWGRWEAGLQGRWYTAETVGAGFGEQGVRAALGMRAREDGTGLAFALSPGWGTQAGVLEEARLLDTLDRDAGTAAAPALHLDGRVSWGSRVGGLFGAGDLLRPYAEFSAGEASRHLRMGLALEGPVTLGLALDRRQDATGPADNGVMLRLDTRF